MAPFRLITFLLLLNLTSVIKDYETYTEDHHSNEPFCHQHRRIGG